MPPWTNEQKKAIDAPYGKNILVSAAAGSGKTAVLSQRVTEFVKKGNPLSELLVVTFTRAAAAEMKARIADNIAKAAEEESDLPRKRHLNEQKMSVFGADITTIDSYCGKLLRRNFQTLGISPDFSIISDTEKNVLADSCFNKLLEEYYSSNKNNFSRAIRLFGGEHSSESFKSAVDKLYNALCSIPFPDKWLDYQLEKYKNPDGYLKLACETEGQLLDSFIKLWNGFIKISSLTEKGLKQIQTELNCMTEMRKGFDSNDWDYAIKQIPSSFPRSFSCTDRETKEYSVYRKKFADFCKQSIFSVTSADAEKDFTELYPQIKAFFDFVKDYAKAIDEKYKKTNVFSFDYICRSALGLLIEDYDFENKSFVKTDLAKQLSESYTEIVIDEYQDINDMQDLLFRALSKEEGNIFAVGDIKQSIYGFRYSNPGNFSERASISDVITLNKNFRSKENILTFINFIFEGLFSEDICDMSYGPDDKLVFGLTSNNLNNNECDCEYIFVNNNTPAVVAAKIRDMLDGNLQVFDKKTNSPRDVRPGDIAVLARKSTLLPDIESAISAVGLTASLKTDASYFDSVEVNTVKALLTVIDNPYDDLAFFGVMFSDLYGVSADTCAKIRAIDKKLPYYDVCREWNAENKDGKVSKLLSDIDKYRLLATTMSVGDILQLIYSETRYPDIVASLDNGVSRRRNLMRFYNFTVNWSDSVGGSLFSYVRYVSCISAKADSSELPPAENDSIRLMTIHASKGLEFPVVFVVDTNGEQDQKKNWEKFDIDRRYGISAKLRDVDMVYEQTTLPYELLEQIKLRDFYGEELRLLYVAMTRARDKLIFVSDKEMPLPTYDEKGKEKSKCKDIALLKGDGILPAPALLLSKKLSYEKMMLPRMVHHNSAGDLLNEYSAGIGNKGLFSVVSGEITEIQPEQHKKEVLSISASELNNLITSGKHAHQIRIPAKLSVTELVKRMGDNDVDSEEMISPEITFREPDFAKSQTLSAAQTGTAIHTFMNFWDFECQIETEINRMVSDGHISDTEAEAVRKNFSHIKSFSESILFSLIKNSDNIWREEEFVCRIPASLYDKSVTDSSEMLIQGAIDLMIEKDGKLTVIDYKTDNASVEEITNRYRNQLYLYKYAAERIYGKPVDKIYIWSFRNNTAIDLTNKLEG